MLSWLAGSVQGPEPAQISGAGAVLVDATDAPLATVDAVVGNVLVEAGAEAGGAHREGHRDYCG